MPVSVVTSWKLLKTVTKQVPPSLPSQLPVDTWHEVIGEPTFADAILDRIVNNSYRMELDLANLVIDGTVVLPAEDDEGAQAIIAKILISIR